MRSGRTLSWKISTTGFDADDRVIAQQDARGYLTALVLDAASQQLAVVDANGDRTSSLFDARGNLYASQDALGAYTSFQFDGVGNTVVRVDARGWPTTYTLDALNRVAGALYIDGTRVTNTFDAADRQITMQDVTGVTTLSWDRRSQQVGVVNGIGKALTYSLDPAGNRVGMVDSDAGLFTYTMDQQNRLTKIVNPFAETTTLVWDALDRDAQRILGNGVALSHAYDPAGRETVLGAFAASGAAIAVYSATYDLAGNRLAVLELDGTRVTYVHDASYQLVNEQRSGLNAYNDTYAWDPVGNRLSMNQSGQVTSYLFNQANELTVLTPPSGQPTTSSWDPNGNLVSENTGGALTTYGWDSEDRLLSVQSSSGTETNTYSADGMRQMHASPSGTVYYVRDGQNVLIETDGNLITQAVYTDLPGMWGGKFSQSRSGVSRFVLPDFQGNTRELTDSGGNVTDTLLTDAWGVELNSTGATVNPFKAFGQWGYYRDNASRLYVRARHLRVDLGRWLSRDPAALTSEVNAYRYVRSRPTFYVDPAGLACMRPCCCCVERLRISGVEYFSDATQCGHEYFLNIRLSYHPLAPGEQAGDCSLEWWEKTNLPYIPAMVANAWNRMDLLIPDSPTLQPWNDRVRPCPGSECVQIYDTPCLNKRDDLGNAVTANRTLCIRPVVKSSGNCICANRQLHASAKQWLKILAAWDVGHSFVFPYEKGYCRFPGR